MNCDDIYEYVNKSDKKIILTLNCGLEKDYDGIKVYNLIEWLLQEKNILKYTPKSLTFS